VFAVVKKTICGFWLIADLKRIDSQTIHLIMTEANEILAIFTSIGKKLIRVTGIGILDIPNSRH